MSKKTAATSTIQTTSTPILLLAFELGEESWLLGFSRGFGEKVLRRKIQSRDTTALMREVARAKEDLGLEEEASCTSCMTNTWGTMPDKAGVLREIWRVASDPMPANKAFQLGFGNILATTLDVSATFGGAFVPS